MAKSQEHSLLMYGWQKNFANKLIGEWRKYIAELDKLPSLHTQNQHTHHIKTYDTESFNTHNNLINGMKSVTFDVTIDETGKKTNIINNSLFPDIIENMGPAVSANTDNRVNKSFILKGICIAFYDEISKYVLQFRYELNGKELINRRFINSYSELNEILDEYIPHIINLLKKEVFYSSTINDEHCFMGEFKVHTETQTSTEKVIQSDVLDTNVAVYNDTNWLNTWNVIYGGKTIKVDNKTKVVNGRGSRGKNYYVTKNKKSNNNAGFRYAITRDEFIGEVKIKTVTETSTEKVIQSDVLDTNVAVYNDTNWLNTWNVIYGGKTIKVDNKTKVVNGRGSRGKNYYVTKNKKSNNNAGFRYAITRDEFIGEILRYDSGDVWTSWRRVWQMGSFAKNGCTGGQPFYHEKPDVEPNWKYNDAWIVTLYGKNINIKNGAKYNNNGRGSRGVNYYRCERTGKNEHYSDSYKNT